jgi:hypothetical protein
MSLERFIKFIKEGEPVSPGTPNRPLQQLDQNIQYLWDVIQAANLGSTVYARMQTIAATLQIGQPVYFNPATARFEAAFAAAESDTATGYLVVPDQAQVWGIVAEKHNATLADILLFGYAQIDISAAIGNEVNGDGSVPAGTWYLSGAGAGSLTRQLPPVTIPVLKSNLSGGVYVNPSFVDFLENHRHYVFLLPMVPAGSVTPPSAGGTHTITSPDVDIQGWLPANHTSFGGLAPAGAKFGYNLAADTSLAALYPPVPLQSACIQMQRPSVYDNVGSHRWYGQQLMEDLVIINRNGIWWMSDCYDEVPWPTILNTSSPSSPSYTACDPDGRDYTMKLYFTRVGFATDNATVSSLRSVDDRLVITCDGTTTPATTGDLQIDLDLQFMMGNTTLPGYTVFKTFNESTNTFDLGPVVEGIYTTSSLVTLSGTPSTFITVDGQTRELFHGRVRLDVLPRATQELPSQLVRLDGVTEENYPVLYLGMPNTIPTSYVVKFEVPADAPTSSNFQFRVRIIGRSSGTLPPLITSYYKTSRPGANLGTPVDVAYSDTTLTMPTVKLISANQAVETESEAFTVASGDIIYIKLARNPAATSDQYAGELGVMQQVGILTAISE